MNTNGAGAALSDEEAHRRAHGITPDGPAPAPAQVVPSEKTREKFILSIANSAGQTKRGILDFLDFQEEQLLKDASLAPIHERIKEVIGYTKRRVHNDISTMRDQVLACFQIYVNGGEIPAFGRTEEQRAAAERTKRAVAEREKR